MKRISIDLDVLIAELKRAEQDCFRSGKRVQHDGYLNTVYHVIEAIRRSGKALDRGAPEFDKQAFVNDLGILRPIPKGIETSFSYHYKGEMETIGECYPRDLDTDLAVVKLTEEEILT